MNIEIYKIIKSRILSLEYTPGSILNEKVLASEFGVSRTPLRNVLNQLESDKLIRVIPRTGILVAEIQFEQIMNTFQVRLGIEEMIGSLAAENITDEHCQLLSKLHSKCEKLFLVKDKFLLMSIDRDVRAILNDCTNNPVLRDISESLYDHTVRLWCVVLEKGGWEEEVQSVMDDIDQTLEVLNGEKSKLGELRRELLIQHIERIRTKFLGAIHK